MSADSYDSSPPRGGGPLHWTRVYLPYGRTAHLLEVGSGCPVVCSHYNREFLGTGSQEEYDRAAAKRLCMSCFRVREHYANHPDPRLGSAHGVEMT